MRLLPALFLGTTSVTALSLPAFLQPYFTPQVPLSADTNMASDDRSISDVLPQVRSINIFAGLTRDIDPISARLDDASKNSTILAPLNSAVQALERKPWEDEEEVRAFGSEAHAYGLGEGERRANDNLRNFVERHIVPASPWRAGDKVQTLAGSTIWWEEKDGRKVIMPSDVAVGSVADKVGNGEVWVLEGVLRKQ